MIFIEKIRNTFFLVVLVFFNLTGYSQIISFVEDTPAAFVDIIGSVVSSDIDNDGDLDVFLIGKTADDEFIAKTYFNDGTGEFISSNDTVFLGMGQTSVVFGDLNNDGFDDLVTIGAYGLNGGSDYKRTRVYLNNGDGYFTYTQNLIGYYRGAIDLADIDNDGDLDLLLTGDTGSMINSSTMYENDGTGYFDILYNNLDEGLAGDAAFADVDNDGDMDFFISGYDNGPRKSELYVKSNNVFVSSQNNFHPFSQAAVCFGDIDGDLDQDLILSGTDNSLSESCLIYKNDGAGNYSLFDDLMLLGLSNAEIKMFDVDLDNDLDLFMTGYADGLIYTQLYRNDGFGNFGLLSGMPFENVFQLNSDNSVDFGDFDNDGDIDILVVGSNFGVVSTRLYRNETYFPEEPEIQDSTCNDELLIGPIPFKNELNINLGDHCNNFLKMRVYDESGRIIIHRKEGLDGNLNLNFQHHSSGFYILQLESTTELKTYKIVKR